MRLLLLILAVLAAAVMLTQAALQDPGYVLITRKPWSVEMSLTFFATLVVFAFVFLYLLLRFLIRTWGMPHTISVWRRQRRLRQAHRSQARGIIHLVQREWREGEKQLLTHVDDCDTPLINYLGAAVAAQQTGDLEKRDKYLSLAHKSAPKEVLAVGLTQAELQQQSAQTELALATLTRLQAASPKNVQVAHLLAKVYRELRDWRGLAALLEGVRKRKLVSGERLDALELETYGELLSADTSDTLLKLWESGVPKRLRQHPELVATYARRLLAEKKMDTCAQLLQAALKRGWDSNLAGLYGRVETRDPVAQLKTVEAWLQEHPNDAQLLLSAGRLAIRNQIWGSARSYLEAAIARDGPAEAYLELGLLLERLDEKNEALEYYRQGLERREQDDTPRIEGPTQDRAGGDRLSVQLAEPLSPTGS